VNVLLPNNTLSESKDFYPGAEDEIIKQTREWGPFSPPDPADPSFQNVLSQFPVMFDPL